MPSMRSNLRRRRGRAVTASPQAVPWKMPRRKSVPRHDGAGLRLGVESDHRGSGGELGPDALALGFDRDVRVPIVGAFPEHVVVDDAVERFGAQALGRGSRKGRSSSQMLVEERKIVVRLFCHRELRGLQGAAAPVAPAAFRDSRHTVSVTHSGRKARRLRSRVGSPAEVPHIARGEEARRVSRARSTNPPP